MTYAELLSDKRWKAKRAIIIERDGNKCNHCENLSYVNGLSASKFSISPDGNRIYVSYKVGRYSSHGRIDVSYNKLLALADRTENFHRCLYVHPSEPSHSVYAIIAYKRTLGDNASLTSIYKSIKWLYTKGLHVHHKYYQSGLAPWEYPDDALLTLCLVCHENLHKNEKVPFLDENGKQISMLTPCSKCSGAGMFPEYSHVQSGICFQCGGARYVELIE
ncbi:hypothetical protein [Pontibacter sp. H249]|uniref:hypothetical protein n=1 Tax=Pontibacter sp. H249 TaxID=3133420 RepID=UPI0030C450B3